jgi:hypothetical protein
LQEPNVRGRSGEDTKAMSTPYEKMPLPMKPDQLDMEDSEVNLFSSDEESEEDQNTCSKSGAQETIRSIITTSGHEKKEDQGVYLESHEVE